MSPHITTMAHWLAAVKNPALGFGAMVSVTAEAGRNRITAGEFTEVVLPRGGEGEGFATLEVWVEHCTDVGENSAGDSAGRLVRIQGTIGLSSSGHTYVQNARVTVLHNHAGPYQQWRRHQAALTQLTQTTAESSAKSSYGAVADQVTAALQRNRQGKIWWAGSERIDAYKDALRKDPQFKKHVVTKDTPLGGPKAIPGLCTLLREAEPSQASLVIISRGGGSVADLSIFDDARLLEAVRQCRVPVLCAIGHRKDAPLIHAVADWAVDVPAEIHGLLRPFCTGKDTPNQRHARSEQRRSEAAKTAMAATRAAAEVPVLRNRLAELDRQLAQSTAHQAALRRDLQVAQCDRENFRHELVQLRARNEVLLREHAAACSTLAEYAQSTAERRITTTYRLIGLVLALFSATFALGLHSLAPAGWHARSSALVAVWLVLTVVAALHALRPRSMGRQPWFWAPGQPDPHSTFDTVNTVSQYNRLLAAKAPPTPRFPLGRWAARFRKRA